MMPRTGSIVVPADVRHLESVCAFVSKAAESAGMNPEEIHHLEIAVDEACTNVVHHAYGDDASKTYTVSYFIEPGAFMVDVLDRGKPFDPRSIPEPDLDAPLEGRPIGGLGIFFIRKFVDDMSYSAEPDGLNRLRLVKFLPAPESASPSGS